MNRVWLIVICSLLLMLSIALRSRKTGRSVLYALAVKLQFAICFVATVLPTLATVIEELPERFVWAWRRERYGDGLEVLRSRKSA